MELCSGICGEYRLIVREDMLACAVGSGSIPVLATPWMVAVMEAAAQNSVAEYLAEGNVTVGTKLDISHMAATPVGMEIRAESELLEVDGRRLVFRVTAYDACDKIGEGTHERFIVAADRFVAKCNAKLQK